MSNIKFNELIQAIENAGYEARSYSGRGMYGKYCLGITCDNPISTILEIVDCLVDDLLDVNTSEAQLQLKEIISAFKNNRMDSMGLSSIIYFPQIKWEDSSEDKESDDEEENFGSVDTEEEEANFP